MKNLIYIVLLFSFFVKAQTISIKGVVRDSIENPIENANVIIKDSLDAFINFNTTNQKGEYEIIIKNQINSFTIEVSSLGFVTQKRKISIKNNIYNQNFILIESTEILKELILEDYTKIKINQDTTFFKISAYTNNTEQTLEDVLKKIPGIIVQSDGSIKAHGKLIDKLLIEGEDIFDKNYKILSKNLDPKFLEEIQILDNFEDNPILKKLSNTDKVALNIKLKKGLSNIWFGNANVGYGNEDRFKESLNIGLFRKKLKGFYFFDYNNLGNKSSDLLNDSFVSNDFNSNKIELTTSKNFNSKIDNLPLFETSQVTFNKAFLNSINLSLKLNNNTTLRSAIILLSDDQNQFNNSFSRYITPNEIIENTDISTINNSQFNGSSEIEVKFYDQKKSYFTNYFKYSNTPESNINSISFNANEVFEKSNIDNERIYHHIENTYLISNSKILTNYLYFGHNSISENAKINYQYIANYFNLPDNETIYQYSNNKLVYAGFKSSFILKKNKWENHFGFLIHNENESMYARFASNQIDNLVTDNSVNEFHKLRVSYNHKTKFLVSKKMFFLTELNLINENLNNKNYALHDFSFNYYYKMDRLGSLNLNFSSNSKLPENSILNNNLRLNAFSNFITGSSVIDKITQRSYSFNYFYNNDLKHFNFDFQLQHQKSEKNYSTQNTIGQNLSFNNYVYLNGNESVTLNLKSTKLISKLHIVSKLEYLQIWSKTPYVLNGESININSNINQYKLSSSTVFQNFINFDFGISYYFYESKLNTIKNKNSFTSWFINSNYNFNDILTLETSNTNYTIEKKSYNFLNTTLVYNLKATKWSFKLSCNNLLNLRKFSNQNSSDFTFYESSQRLLPRYFLGIIKYRF